MSDKVYRGSCYCGATKWEATGKPSWRSWCHCTLCQRLTGGSFVHTVGFPEPNFKWTHEEPAYGTLDGYVVADKPWKTRWRCKTCGACIASFHGKRNSWSIWGSQLERDEEGKIKNWEDLKPRIHIFYGTRLLDITDDLPKWGGYEDRSERLG